MLNTFCLLNFYVLIMLNQEVLGLVYHSIQGVSCLWENSIYGIQGASCLWESSINSMFCSIYKDPNLGWHPGPCSGIQSMVMHWLNKVENAKKKKIGFEIRT